MAVKHVQSATRVLATFEALADHQPVGFGALAVVLDVAESNQLVRTVPGIGLVVPPLTSAAGQAILAHLPVAQLPDYGVTDGIERLAAVRARGWSVNDRDATPGASAVGAAILD